MLHSTSTDYSKYAQLDIESKLKPINQTVDEMLTRLEEFETMVALVQKERCSAIGLTGALMETVDLEKEFSELCSRIDVVENLVEYVKVNVDCLEKKVEVAEEQFGLVDNTNKLKNFFLPLFKKSPESRNPSPAEPSEPFSIDKYFIKDDNKES